MIGARYAEVLEAFGGQIEPFCVAIGVAMSGTAVVTPEAESSDDRDSTHHAGAAVPEAPSGRRWSPHFGTVVVLIVGLAITSGLSAGARSLHNTNEDRLLRQRVREVAAVVTAAVPNLQTPLSSAAVLVEATNADEASFRKLMTPIVSTGRPFNSVSVWSASSTTQPRLVEVVGGRPELESQSPEVIARTLRQAIGHGSVTLNDLLSAPERRLGYAYAAPEGRFVVYAEAALPKNRRATIDKDSAFADLDYALYLGNKPSQRELLASSTGGAIIHGRRASETVPFGNTSLHLVMSSNKQLGGNLLARLPWALAVFGVILTLGGVSLVERLQRRRDHAESLALENAQLYDEQRTVAQTLQHSLLPETLPNVAGLQFATRYVAGVEGIDVGGDWYDVMTVDNGQILFVVGDVSGRGLRAATTMAELRYAVRAYAAQGDPPAEILTKVSRLIDVARDGHFATALCGTIDVIGHRVTLANAGHPDALVVANHEAWYADTTIGPPLGVKGAPYHAVTVSVPERATLLAYTDGLVERRGENLDIGFERLKRATLQTDGTVEELLTSILDQAIPGGSADDTAILGMRWDN